MLNSSSPLSERMGARVLENTARCAAMTGADRRREDRADAAVTMQSRRYLADMAHRTGDHAYARRLLATSPAVPRAARPRGAGRPAGRATARSSARSGDSGDGEPGEPPPPAVAVTIAAGDSELGDSAVARTFERILAAQRPGATWSATP